MSALGPAGRPAHHRRRAGRGAAGGLAAVGARRPLAAAAGRPEPTTTGPGTSPARSSPTWTATWPGRRRAGRAAPAAGGGRVPGRDAAGRDQRRPAGGGLRRRRRDGGRPGLVDAALLRARRRPPSWTAAGGRGRPRAGRSARFVPSRHRGGSPRYRAACRCWTRRARPAWPGPASCSTPGRRSATAASTSRWTRWPGTSPARSARPRRATSARTAGSCPRTSSGAGSPAWACPGAAAGRRLLRLGGHRRARGAGPGPGRPPGRPVPGLLVGLGHRRRPPGRDRSRAGLRRSRPGRVRIACGPAAAGARARPARCPCAATRRRGTGRR